MTGGDAPFLITRPPASAPRTALVFASPHSGDRYPADMAPAPGLSSQSLRSAEDALVGRLVAEGPRRGAALIEGRIGRAYVDLNRDPSELDPALIADLDGPVGAKTAAGYGVIPRLAGDGTPLVMGSRRLVSFGDEPPVETMHGDHEFRIAFGVVVMP